METMNLSEMMKNRRLCFDMEQMCEAPAANESFALIKLLDKNNPKVMDDKYVESIIAQLIELGSGEIFVDYALGHIDYARSQISGEPMVKTISSISW